MPKEERAPESNKGRETERERENQYRHSSFPTGPHIPHDNILI